MKIPALRRTLPAGILLLAALGLAACASDAPPRGEGPPGKHGPQRQHGPQLFISLAGEPFRAGPDQPYPLAAWFARADANHDGRLDRAEVRADATAFFHVLDANHDGVIDSFEISDYEQKIVPEILGAYLGDAGRGRGEASGQAHGGEGGESGGRRGHGGRRGGEGQGQGGSPQVSVGGGYEGAAPFELTDEPEPVAAADLNVSGRITLKEFLQTVDRRFNEIDVNHNGSIALADLPKTPIQRLVVPARGRSEPPGDKGPPPR